MRTPSGLQLLLSIYVCLFSFTKKKEKDSGKRRTVTITGHNCLKQLLKRATTVWIFVFWIAILPVFFFLNLPDSICLRVYKIYVLNFSVLSNGRLLGQRTYQLLYLDWIYDHIGRSFLSFGGKEINKVLGKHGQDWTRAERPNVRVTKWTWFVQILKRNGKPGILAICMG